ncbi:hypothetical protein O159_22860 [Leifsonia xyli subsp. cynodontis DSM 46306]|jgi:hypothetical protein|uniref:Uncharacterized protein n=1 Tax=Leifsonia xyli subsp. cynodontis DSM 46306 TaxID=1389489 RepID=U3P9P3_LEIXC|nr:hypothetical protein [Leifsonia xyli]AGW41726.1 hypothetical protein O159_16810 [Leifsonia xyli subsp. cynodontis DSM 46306]AGW42249.1 hypothetical protein O159_22860 [Leifsonia xyli subsp. cynodontis DSM 46306]
MTDPTTPTNRATPTTVEALAAERDTYAQALWDVYGILGFDRDGDPTPAACLTSGAEDFANSMVAAAWEARENTEEAVREERRDALEEVRAHRIKHVFQERPNEYSYRCSCGFLVKHIPFGGPAECPELSNLIRGTTDEETPA